MKCYYEQNRKKNKTSKADKEKLYKTLNQPLKTLFSKGFAEFEKQYGSTNKGENK